MKGFSQKQAGCLLLVLSLAAGIPLFILEQSLLWYWLFGLGFGYILQRSHVCFVSAASDPVIYGSTDQIRAILIGILVASVGIYAFKFLSNGRYDSLGVAAISLPLVLGAFLFGIGMILAGCCCSGMFIRLGEGYLVHSITLLCVIMGYCLANTHYQTLWAPFVAHSPSVFLPEKLGWQTGALVNTLILLTIYFLASKWEKHPAAEANTAYLKGAVCLGVACVIHVIVLKTPWSVSGAFYWVGDLIARLGNGTLDELLSCSASSMVALGTNLRNLGLLIGALLSALLGSRFHVKKINSRGQVIKSVIGGLCMGYGACIAGGCNITSFFMAAASFSLSGWVFLITLFAGALVGVKLLYKFV